MNQLMNCIHSALEQLNNKYIIDEDTFKLANDSNLIPFLYLSMDDKTNEDIKNKIKNQSKAYILYDSMQAHELDSIKNIFRKNQIKYSILKGPHLQKYYNESYLRYMCDFDVFVEKKDLSKAGKLIEGLGYSLEDETNHDICYKKNPFHVELHFMLIPNKEHGAKYFKDPFSLMEEINGEYQFKKKEDEYIFYFFHLLKHYIENGIGLKNYIDIYLFIKNNELNFDYIHKLYKYTKYEDECIYLEKFIINMFNDNEEYDEFIKSIFDNKLYGSKYNLTKNELKHKTTFRWLLSKTFPTITQMKNYYKCLNKKTGYVLLPFLYIHHIFYFGIVKFKYSINRIKLAKKIKKEEYTKGC